VVRQVLGTVVYATATEECNSTDLRDPIHYLRGPIQLLGSVNGSSMTFTVPNEDPSNPDCQDWDLTYVYTLQGANTLSLHGYGTVCGSLSGAAVDFHLTLKRQ